MAAQVAKAEVAEQQKKLQLDDLERQHQHASRQKKDQVAASTQSSSTQLLIRLCVQLLHTIQQTVPIMFQQAQASNRPDESGLTENIEGLGFGNV